MTAEAQKMVIISEYRLDEQGGFLFREDKRNKLLPDMCGIIVDARASRTCVYRE